MSDPLLSSCLHPEFQSSCPSAPNFFLLVYPSLIYISLPIFSQSLSPCLSFLFSFSLFIPYPPLSQSHSPSAPLSGPFQAQNPPATMSGDYEDDLCRRALILVSDLCARVRDADTSDRCQEFNDLRIRGYPRGPDAGQQPPQLFQPAPCVPYTQYLQRFRDSEQTCSAFCFLGGHGQSLLESRLHPACCWSPKPLI